MAAPLVPTPSLDWNAIMLSAFIATPPGGEPDSSVDPLITTCRLHGPRSLYTRNSEGYYSTFSPICNGCSVGAHETQEHAAAERVRELHTELRTIWATEYGRHITAESTATALRDAIAALDEISMVIINPQQYATRMLVAHTAATELHAVLTEATVRIPTVTLRLQIYAAMENLRTLGEYAVGDPMEWPIWAAATETLAAMDDASADDTY